MTKMKGKWTSDEIECAVAKFYGVRQNIIVPNVSWGFGYLGHECDMLIVSGSGYATEIEIKISKSDLKRDLSKGHNHKSDLIKSLFYAVPIELFECAVEFLPKDVGIMTIEMIYPLQFIPFTKTTIARPCTRKDRFRKITERELMQLMRLGCMRIFTLKEKIIKLRTK
jgi:hypothetical protein